MQIIIKVSLAIYYNISGIITIRNCFFFFLLFFVYLSFWPHWGSNFISSEEGNLNISITSYYSCNILWLAGVHVNRLYNKPRDKTIGIPTPTGANYTNVHNVLCFFPLISWLAIHPALLDWFGILICLDLYSIYEHRWIKFNRNWHLDKLSWAWLGLSQSMAFYLATTPSPSRTCASIPNPTLHKARTLCYQCSSSVNIQFFSFKSPSNIIHPPTTTHYTPRPLIVNR